VEGSVLRVGDKVRITAQLIKAVPEKHLWAEDHVRDLKDILKLQSDLAQAIAKEIHVMLTPQEQTRFAKDRQVNPEAYDAYLMAIYYSENKMQFRKAVEYCEKATRIDPNYAEAYSYLAMSYVGMAEFGYQVEELDVKAKAAALKSLAIDSTLVDAHTALGAALYHFDWDWLGAESHLKRAIVLNPNSMDAYDFYGLYLLLTGRFNEAIAAKIRARELAPTAIVSNFSLAYAYYCARRYNEAIAQCKKTLELDPTHWWTRYYLAHSYSKKNMHEKALALSQELKLEENYSVDAARLYAKAGRRNKALKLIEGVTDLSAFREVASTYAILGEIDKAFDWLEKAYQDHQFYIIWLKAEPFLDPLHADPRFQELLKKIGLEK
jgi:tetratricopeptide (TPR) repeat protein